MKTQHTQGEWRPIIDLDKAGDYCVHSEGKKICDLPDQSEESRANAKLIAAAPDLLEALIVLRKHFSGEETLTNPERWVDVADFAIDKAGAIDQISDRLTF